MTGPTDAVVGALEAARLGAPIDDVDGPGIGTLMCCASDVRLYRAQVAFDLPAILRATLPHWSAEDKREVLRALLEERLERMNGDELDAIYAAQNGLGADGPDDTFAPGTEHGMLLDALAPTSERSLERDSEETRDGE